MSEKKSMGVFKSWAVRRLTRKLKEKKEKIALLENQLLKETFKKDGKPTRKTKKLNKKISSIKEDMIKMAKKLMMKNGKIVEVDKDEVLITKTPEVLVIPEPTYVGPKMQSSNPPVNTDSFNSIIAENEALENYRREEQVRAQRELQNKSQVEMMRQQQNVANQELARREAVARQQLQNEQQLQKMTENEQQLDRQYEMAEIMRQQQKHEDYLREQRVEQEYLQQQEYARQQQVMAQQQAMRPVEYVITVECINERVFDIPAVASEVERVMNEIAQAVDESSSIKLGEYSINGRHIISWYVR